LVVWVFNEITLIKKESLCHLFFSLSSDLYVLVLPWIEQSQIS